MSKRASAVALSMGAVLGVASWASAMPVQAGLIDQKAPSSLAKRREPIAFRLIEELNIEAIRKPCKIIIQEGRLFILDRALSQVLVTDS